MILDTYVGFWNSLLRIHSCAVLFEEFVQATVDIAVTNGTIDINICEFQRVKSTSYPPVNVCISMENGPIVVLPI